MENQVFNLTDSGTDNVANVGLYSEVSKRVCPQVFGGKVLNIR